MEENANHYTFHAALLAYSYSQVYLLRVRGLFEPFLREMHPSIRLLHQCRITLFTRANCSLCTNAKQTLSTVWDKRPFDYKEIDVMKPEGAKWKDLYEFDTPVVRSIWQERTVPANGEDTCQPIQERRRAAGTICKSQKVNASFQSRPSKRKDGSS
jgi:glutaredoxin